MQKGYPLGLRPILRLHSGDYARNPQLSCQLLKKDVTPFTWGFGHLNYN